jgi:hypothetical protein
VIILQLFPGLLTNGVAEILESAPENLPQEKGDKVSLVIGRQTYLASAFRKFMTEGQTYYTSNPYRKKFYADVIEEATEVNFLSFPVLVRMTVFSSL